MCINLQNCIIEEPNIEKNVLVHYCGHYEMQDKLFRSIPLLQSENKLLLTSSLGIVHEMQKYPFYGKWLGVIALQNF